MGDIKLYNRPIMTHQGSKLLSNENQEQTTKQQLTMEIHLKPETTTIDNGDTHLKQDLKQQQLTMEIHLKLTIEIYLNKKHLNKLYLKKQH